MNAIDYLRERFRTRVLTRDYSGAPFAGGAVGFLSYGAAKWFEPVLGELPSDADDAAFLLFRTMLAFDHAKQVVEIRTLAFTGGANDSELRKAYEAALAELERVAQLLAAPLALDAPLGSPADAARKSRCQVRFQFRARRV